MDKLYVIQDQYGYFLSRQDEWVEPGTRETVYRGQHRDLALNTLVELNTRNADLRAAVVEVDSDEHGRPLIANLTPPAVPQAIPLSAKTAHTCTGDGIEDSNRGDAHADA